MRISSVTTFSCAVLSCVALPLAIISPASPARADEDLISGPRAESELTPVKAYAATGPQAGKEFDAVKLIGKGPGAILFIHELSRNILPMVRGLDRFGQEYKELGFRSFTVMLHTDRTKGEERIKTVSNAVKLANPLVLSLDGIEGPGGFALNRKCTLTLVTMKDGKVCRSVAYTDTNPDDVPELQKLVEEVTGSLREAYRTKLPKESEELREHALDLSIKLHELRREVEELRRKVNGYEKRMGKMRGGRGGGGRDRAMRRSPEGRPATGRERNQRPNPNQQRVGKAPEDPELVALLRQVISKFSEPEDVDEAFALIDGYVGKDKGLEKQAIEMFKLMLHLEYGSDHAKKLAREYLEKRGVERPAKKAPTKKDAGRSTKERKKPAEGDAPKKNAPGDEGK